MEKPVEKTMEETTDKVLNAKKINPKITAKELEVVTGLSRRGSEYQLNKLKKHQLIARIGPEKGGEWGILDKNEI
jgi:ATP-dependent DNA helicase RecG